MTKDETGSLLSQGLSVLQSGGLNGASYLNLWGVRYATDWGPRGYRWDY